MPSNYEICDIDSASIISDNVLRELLNQSFPGMFETRSYFKQEPHSRLVAHAKNELIGHVGIDKRVFNVAGEIIRVVGVVDLCVAKKYRSNGIGAALIKAVEEKFNDREFVVLMADNPALYLKLNYAQLTEAPARWLAIEGLKSHSIVERDLGDCFMYKQLTNKCWPNGEIDLLGYLY